MPPRPSLQSLLLMAASTSAGDGGSGLLLAARRRFPAAFAAAAPPPSPPLPRGVRAAPFTYVAHALAVADAAMVLYWCIHFHGGLAFEAANKNLIFNCYQLIHGVPGGRAGGRAEEEAEQHWQAVVGSAKLPAVAGAPGDQQGGDGAERRRRRQRPKGLAPQGGRHREEAQDQGQKPLRPSFPP